MEGGTSTHPESGCSHHATAIALLRHGSGCVQATGPSEQRCTNGVVTGTWVGTHCDPTGVGSCGRGRDLPRIRRLSPKDPKRAAGDEVALNVECVVNSSVRG